jgi:hypothetical protein
MEKTMRKRSIDWKSRILAFVIFLLFLLDLGEFVVWKIGKVVGPLIKIAEIRRMR